MSSIIYGLIDPRTCLVRYVGKSVRGQARLDEHRWKQRRYNTYCVNWISSLHAAGVTFETTILEECEPSNLNEAERWWIAYGRALGWPLTNLTEGGDGGRTGALSPETRAKISTSLKGHPVSPETRALQSAKAKARWARGELNPAKRPEVRAKISAAKNTPEAKRAASEARKAYWARRAA